MALRTVRNESPEEALERLAAKARELGVRLKRDRDGRHYASSVSEPGRWHYVTGYSCDCRGFVHHGRCMHYAALMSALGWIRRPEPEPTDGPHAARNTYGETATAPVRCPACNGLGEVPSGHAAMFGIAWQPCRECRGTGRQGPGRRAA